MQVINCFPTETRQGHMRWSLESKIHSRDWLCPLSWGNCSEYSENNSHLVFFKWETQIICKVWFLLQVQHPASPFHPRQHHRRLLKRNILYRLDFFVWDALFHWLRKVEATKSVRENGMLPGILSVPCKEKLKRTARFSQRD